jgi:hypothetical protein
MKMRTSDTYWQKVRNIAVSALADAGSDDERDVADDYLENDGCLEVPVANLERIVAYSNHPNAFNEWEQGDVKEESLRWWWVRAFYAMAQDVYDHIDRLKS